MSRNPPPRVLGLCGRLWDASRTCIPVDEALAAANEAGAKMDLADRTYRLGEHLAAYAGVPTYPEMTAEWAASTSNTLFDDAS